MGEGGAGAELHVAVQPDLPRRAARARAACTTSPSARRTPNTTPGRERLQQAAHPEQRQGRPLLFPQPLFPRAERHPVRDRHRRPGLRRRRAAGDARREARAAAVPGGPARGDRGGAEAAVRSVIPLAQRRIQCEPAMLDCSVASILAMTAPTDLDTAPELRGCMRRVLLTSFCSGTPSNAARASGDCSRCRKRRPLRPCARTMSSGAPFISRREIATALGRQRGDLPARPSCASASTSVRRRQPALTSPQAFASSPRSSGLPITSNSNARRWPIRRGAIRLDAASGTRPSATNGVEKRASLAGDRIVAMEHHGGADADRDALHGGDQRLFGPRQRIEKADDGVAEPLAAGRGLMKSPQIVAGRECAGRAADQHAADRRRPRSRSRSPPPSRRTSREVSAFFFSGRFIRMVRTRRRR